MWIAKLRPCFVTASPVASTSAASLARGSVSVGTKGKERWQPVRIANGSHARSMHTAVRRVRSPRLGVVATRAYSTSLADILIAHPIVSYGTTIVLLTLTLRTAITLPMALWSRARLKRIRTIVQPEMKLLNEKLAVEVMKDCRKRGLGYEDYRAELKKQLATHQSALHKQHKTHPLPTLLAPIILHLPLFLLVSYTIRTASASPEFMAETHPSLLPWIESMGQVDPNGILPIAIGVVAFSNAEWADLRRKRVEAALDVQAENEAARRPRVLDVPIDVKRTKADVERAGIATPGPLPPRAKDPTARPARSPTSPTAPSFVRQPRMIRPPLTPDAPIDGAKLRKRNLRGKVVTNLMRILAIAFVPVALEVPAALALYWLTSVSYSLVQNTVLDWFDAREERAVKPAATESAT